jgi:hypothetical protein
MRVNATAITDVEFLNAPPSNYDAVIVNLDDPTRRVPSNVPYTAQILTRVVDQPLMVISGATIINVAALDPSLRDLFRVTLGIEQDDLLHGYAKHFHNRAVREVFSTKGSLQCAENALRAHVIEALRTIGREDRLDKITITSNIMHPVAISNFLEAALPEDKKAGIIFTSSIETRRQAHQANTRAMIGEMMASGHTKLLDGTPILSHRPNTAVPDFIATRRFVDAHIPLDKRSGITYLPSRETIRANHAARLARLLEEAVTHKYRQPLLPAPTASTAVASTALVAK